MFVAPWSRAKAGRQLVGRSPHVWSRPLTCRSTVCPTAACVQSLTGAWQGWGPATSPLREHAAARFQLLVARPATCLEGGPGLPFVATPRPLVVRPVVRRASP
eukprot:14254226-Alexandrium_andersonii.AAC.1